MALNLNEKDVRILTLLQENARISDRNISRKIHLSPNAVSLRINRLEDENYIQQYTTVLNKSKLNLNLQCFVGVNLTQNNFQTVTLFLSYLNSLPGLIQFYRINNVFDFFLRIVSKDIHDYHRLFVNKLANLPCVSNVTTFVILNEGGSNMIDMDNLVK